jgi:hypothetical protein
MFDELRKQWSEAEIVEIVAAVAATGFVTRWDSGPHAPSEQER